MADKDQRDAREADVARRDRRRAEPEEGSNDPRHKQMDTRICSEGIRFLEAPSRPPSREVGRGCRTSTPPHIERRSHIAYRVTKPYLRGRRKAEGRYERPWSRGKRCTASTC